MTTGLLILLMVASFYFLIIRPSRKRQTEQAQLAQSLKPGVRVMLSSGIFGTVLEVGERQTLVEIAPGVSIRVLKQAILQAVTPDSQFAEDTDLDAETGADDQADAALADDQPTDFSRPEEGGSSAAGPFPSSGDGRPTDPSRGPEGEKG